MSTYNLSSNMSDRMNFDQMVERTLADALEAYGTVGQWNMYFDLAELDVDDQDEAAARIAAIWPEVEEGEEYRKPASADTEWHEVLGNHISALETYQVYVGERTEGEKLAAWIERKNTELWGNEAQDISGISDKLALFLLIDAAQYRVQHNEALEEYEETIMDDSWGADADHLEWVCTADVSEIVNWAEATELAAE